jgi:hypothetical protein
MKRGGSLKPIPGFEVFFVKVRTPQGTSYVKVPKQDLTDAEGQAPTQPTTPAGAPTSGDAPKEGDSNFVPEGINRATGKPYEPAPPGYKYVDQGNGIWTLRVK